MLGFNADTTQAQQAIKQLNAQLNNIQSLKLDNLGINQELTQAANAAKTLQTALQAAFNANTGQINMTTFSQQLKLAETNVSTLGNQLAQIGPIGASAFAQMSKTVSLMDVPVKNVNKTLSNMITTLKNTAKWEMSSAAIHGLESSFSNALNYVTELNEALTDIRVVSGQTVEQMTKFAEQANLSAKALGTTTKEYAKAALTYYQQGDSAELASKKAEITLKATNVAFKATASEMSEMLTATWNGFQAGADELEHYVDVMANLGSHTASSVEEIATALQKVAATANTVGMSMEQMSAMIATVSSATRQSASVVGTALNTILSRFASLKLGETLEDGVDLTKYTKALKAVGVNVLDTTGNLREMGTIVDEVMQKWETMNESQKVALAQTVGGVRQYTNMMALFNNQAKYQENLGYAQNADGALQKMEDTYLSGLEGAKKQLRAATEGIWQDIIDDQALIGATKSLTVFIDQIHNLINSLGGLSGIATTVGGIMMQVFSKQIGTSLSNTVTSMKTFAQSFAHIQGTTGWDTFKQRANSFFTENTNQRMYQQQSQQLQAILPKLRGEDINDPALDAQVNASQILLEKKSQLVAIESQLDGTQKAAAHAQIDALQAQATELDKIGQAYKENNIELEHQSKSLQDNTARIQAATNLSMQQQARARDNEEAGRRANWDTYNLMGKGLLPSLNINENTSNNINKIAERFATLNAVVRESEQNITRIGNTLEHVQEKGFEQSGSSIQNMINYLEQYRDHLKEIGASSDSIDKINNAINKLKGASDLNTFNSAVEETRTVLQELGDNATVGVDTAIEILSNRLGISTDRLNMLAEQAGITREQLIKLAMATKEVEKTSDNLNLKQNGLSKTLTKITATIGSAMSGFSSMNNLMSNWDTSNIASKVTGIGSMLMSVVNGFKQGIVSGIITAAATLTGAVVGVFEKIEKERQKIVETANKTNSTSNENVKNELDATKELIKNYNELYERYQLGEDVQNELAESAQKLAAAYGVAGAAVAQLTGNYEDFNKALANTLGLNNMINNAQVAVEAASRVSKNLKVDKTDIVSIYGFANNFQQASESEQAQKTFEGWANLLQNRTVSSGSDIWKIIGDAFTNYLHSDDYQKYIQYQNGTIDLSYEEEDRLWSKFQDVQDAWKEIGRLVNNTGAIGQGTLARGSKTWGNDGLSILASNIDTSTFKANDGTLGEQLQAMFQNTGDQRTFRGALYSDQFTSLVIGLQQLDMSLLSGYEDIELITKQVTEAAWDTEKIFENSEGLFDFDESTGEGTFKFALKDKSMEEISQTYHKYEKWKESLELLRSKIADDESGEAQYIDKLIKNINKILNSDDGKLSEAVQNYDYATQYLAEMETVRNTITASIGKNEATTNFKEYLEFSKSLEEVIKDNPALDKTGELITLDPVEQAEAYNAALQRVKERLIDDYTSFDDYVIMEQAIADTFAEDQQQKITDFVSDNDIKSINGRFIHLLQAIFNKDADAIIEDYKEQLQNALLENNTETPGMDLYTTQTKAYSSLKKSMSLEDSQNIYESFFANLDDADEQWIKFINATYEDRQQMLSNMIKESQKTALEEAKSKAIEAKEQAENTNQSAIKIFGIGFAEEAGENAITYYKEFEQYLDNISIMKNGVRTAKEGSGLTDQQIQQLEQGNYGALFNTYGITKGWFSEDYITKQQGEGVFETFQSFKDFYTNYQDWLNQTGEADNLASVEKYFEAVGEAADGAATKVSKLVSAFSSLPTTEVDMDKLVEFINDKLYPSETPYTAESLSELYRTNKNKYQDVVIRTAQAYYDSLDEGTAKTLAGLQVEQMKESKRVTKLNTAAVNNSSELTQATSKLAQLQAAFKEKATTGQLSTQTQSALHLLGIKPESIQDLNTLSAAIKEVQQQIIETKNNAKNELRQNGIIITDEIEAINQTWEQFSEGKNYDDALKPMFEAWQKAYKEAHDLTTNWDEDAIRQSALIAQSVANHKKEVEQLTTEYNQLKNLEQKITTAFTNNTQLDAQTLTILKNQNINLAWGKTQEANLANYGKILGQTALAQYNMLKKQKYDLSEDQLYQKMEFLRNTNYTIPRGQDLTMYSSNSLSKMIPQVISDSTLVDRIISEVETARSNHVSITWEEIYKKLKAENDDLDSQMATVWDNFASSGIAAVESVLNVHQSVAQQIVATWEAAFQAIAAAQEAFAQGSNLNYVLDQNNLTTIAQQLFNIKNGEQQMFTYDQVLTLLAGGSVTISGQTYTPEQAVDLANQQLELPIGQKWAQAQGGATMFLYDKEGNRATTKEQLEQNARNEIGDLWQNYLDNMSQGEKEAFEKYRQEHGNGITDQNADWAKFVQDYIINELFGSNQDIGQLFIQALASEAGYNAYYSGQKLKNAEATAQAAVNSQQQKLYADQISELTKTQTALNKAQELKLKGQDLATNLTPDEIRRVLQATGQTDIANVSLGDLSAASQQAAGALAALAAAAEAAAAAEMQKAGFGKGADGKWYKQETKTDSELSNEEKASGLWTNLQDGTWLKSEYSDVVTGLMATFTDALMSAQDAVTSFSQNQLATYASALGETVDTIGSYCEAIATANGLTMDWNSLTEDQQLLMAEAALGFKETSEAISDIISMGKENGILSALLGTADETTLSKMTIADIADGYRQIVAAVNELYGSGAVNADFFNAATEAGKGHLELLQKIAEGGEAAAAAIEKLEREIISTFNEDNKLGFSEEDIDSLNNFANGLKYGEELSAEQLNWINNFIKLNRLSVDQVEKLGEILGLTLDVEHEVVQIPKDVKGINSALKNVSDTTKSAGERAANMAAAFTAIQRGLKDSTIQAGQFDDAMKEAWNSVLQDPEALSDLTQLLGKDGMVELTAKIAGIDTSVIDGWADMPLIKKLEFLADIGAIENLDVDKDGTIHYSVEGADLSMHNETEEGESTTSGGSTSTLNGTITLPFGLGTTSWSGTMTTESTGEGETIASFPVLDGAKVNKGTSHRGGSSGGGGGGKSGGSGGGGGPKKHDTKTEHPERYHEVTKELDEIAKALEKVDKLKDRTYGAQHLKQLEAELKLLKEQKKQHQEYLNEANAYLAADRQDVQGAFANAIFDETGDIANWTQLQQQLLDEYNAMAETEMEEEEWKEFTKGWEQRKKYLDDYEDSLAKYREQVNNILEDENLYSQKLAEIVAYKVEIRVTLNQNDIKTLEYYIKKWDKQLDLADESYESMQKQADLYTDTLTHLMEAKDELDALYAHGTGELNAADYEEQLSDLNSKILENLESLDTLDKKMKSWYGETLTEAYNKLTDLTNVIDHNNKVISNFVEILELTGQGEEYDKIAKMYDAQARQSEAKTAMLQQHLNALREEEIRLTEALAQSPENEYLKEHLDSLQKQIRTAEEDMQTSLIETLQAIHDAWDKRIDETLKKWKNAVSATGEDLDWMKQKWDYWNEEQEMYVDTITEVYEMNKLNRKIDEQMAKTRDKTNRQQLANLREEINLKSKSAQLTKYDLEMMDLQYQLLVKKQQLEDAQNAKNKVRLTRDENGNMIYQYTADEEKVNQVAQEYEDVLYQINQKTEEEYKRLGNQLVKYEEDMAAAMDEVMRNQNLSAEERERRLQEIYDHYAPLIQATADQMEAVQLQSNINQEVWTKKFGANIMENAHTTNDQTKSIIDNMVENVHQFLSVVSQGYTVEYPTYTNRMISETSRVQNQFEASYSAMDNRLKLTVTAMEQTEKAADALTNTIEDSLKSIADATAAWEAYYNKMKEVRSESESYNQTINDTLRLLASQNAASSATSIPTPSTPSNTLATTSSGSSSSSSSGGGGGSSGGGGSGGTPAKTETSRKWVPKGPSGHIIKITWSDGTTSESGSIQAHNKDQKIPNGAKLAVYCTVCGYQHPSEDNPAAQSQSTSEKSSGGGGCFVAGTKIIMADNTKKNIEDIKVGDNVIAYNDETKLFEPRKVTKSYIHHNTPRVLNITFSNGLTLGMTPGHPILTIDGWKSRDIENSLYEHNVIASWLNIGDIVIGYEQNTKIINIQECIIPEHYDTYNIEVETCHTFMVEGLVVHNMKAEVAFGTGGLNDFTGPAWLDGTKQKPEYVLNAEQTEQMFGILNNNTIKNLINTMQQATVAMLAGLTTAGTIYGPSNHYGGNTAQEVTIYADFPNATDQNEIRDALEGLMARASQNAVTFLK